MSVPTDAAPDEAKDMHGEDVGGAEAPVPEATGDASPSVDVADRLTGELPPEGCKAGEGCFLDPCSDNKQCLSGYCLDHMGDGVCTQTCSEECPAGWTCEALSAGGRDLVYVCVSAYANLCRPCETGLQCQSASAEDVCVSYGTEGSFCGGKCEATQECPWGFSCKNAVSVDGVETMQCVADAGVCPCTAKSVELGLWTPCEVENGAGVCEGKRICGPDGLSGCDAATPAGESCNGLDDDCDGETDEPVLSEGKYLELCDDGNECTADLCKAADGCSYELLTGGECVDGDACTVGDHCQNGVCSGLPVLCDDSDPCTDDSCDGFGGCTATFNEADCNDNDPCTVADRCKEGTCGGFAVDCECQDDGDCGKLEDADVCNGVLYCDKEKLPFTCAVVEGSVVSCPPAEGVDAPCLAAVCDPGTGGCYEAPANDGHPCDDGSDCTIGESCIGGACGGGVPLFCNDGNPCTDDSCESGYGCKNVPNVAPCDDDNACTTGDNCSAGKCTFTGTLSCDDSDVCTDDLCSPVGGCTYTLSDAPCNDGDMCTTGDHCHLGQCIGSGKLPCDDSNLCTDDVCEPGGGCTHSPNSAACDDGNKCTSGDVCSKGWCKGTAPVPCNDSNPCTDDSCGPASGCVFTPNNAGCDDGSACSSGDKCAEGKCAGGPPLDCDDANPCTDDSCTPATGCVHAPNLADCSDQNDCTSGDKCSQGSCAPGTPIVCVDADPCTDDTCLPATGCSFPANAAPCNDGDPCTTGDACSGGACGAGAGQLSCDDANQCTQDSCVPLQGCTHVPVPENTPCGQGNHCQSGQCVPSVQASCLSWKLAAQGSPDGTYTVDPDGAGGSAPFQVYCDMTQDGGGWTLVFRDNIDGAMQPHNTGAQGNSATLVNLDGSTAKYDDVTINKLRAANDNRMGYRCTSPTVPHHYFFPSACSYVHETHDKPECRRYSYTFSSDNNPSYQQCTNWGGAAGGLDAWYGCNGSGNYTNVVKTHSDNGRGMAGITDNFQGNNLGAAGGTVQSGAPPGCGYGNKIYMWVR